MAVKPHSELQDGAWHERIESFYDDVLRVLRRRSTNSTTTSKMFFGHDLNESLPTALILLLVDNVNINLGMTRTTQHYNAPSSD